MKVVANLWTWAQQLCDMPFVTASRWDVGETVRMKGWGDTTWDVTREKNGWTLREVVTEQPQKESQ